MPTPDLEETRPTGHGRARGLVSSRRSGSRVHARTFAPPPDLPALEALWCGSWDLRGQEPHRTELLGSPAFHIVCEGGCVRVVGVWTRLWTRTLQGRGSVRAAKLKPGAAGALLPQPWRLRNRRESLADHLPCDGLAAAVEAPRDEAAGLAALADWLRPRLRLGPDGELAIRLVAEAEGSGLTRVDELAERGGLSVRALQRLFREHVGASPKWVIRRVRLQEAAVRLERGVDDLAELALELGYADQSHLARDFRAATGQTLRGFARGVHG